MTHSDLRRPDGGARPEHHYDVVILGTGLAALGLTRLLHLQCPEASVFTLDVRERPDRKVGESTVEIGAHFLHTRLQLDDLLRQTQLPKNGLRFWFDDAQHELSLMDASEDGPMAFSYWTSYQLDREVLEHTLLELNRGTGAQHELGVADVHIQDLGTNGEPHRVSFVKNGVRREVTSRWLVDATGIKSLWGRRAGLLAPEERVPHGACWARFKGFLSPDDLLESHGNAKPVFGRRLLSTNHLMNEGYWIWWIPLAGGLMSVGVVYDTTVLDSPPTNLEEFVEFLGKHRMCRELMAEAEPLDFGRLGKYAFRPQRYFSGERTAAIGVASGFVDPFYSTGSDFIAFQSECLCDLITKDLAGSPPRTESVEAYNAFLKAFYEQTVLVVRDVYKTFASYEVSVPRYRRDLHVYWNIWVWPYLSREFLDPAFVREFLPLAEAVRQRSEFFNRLFVHLYEELKGRGEAHRKNRGEYVFNQLGYGLFSFIHFERQMGSPLNVERARRLLDEIDAATLLAVMDIRFGGRSSPVCRLPFEALYGQNLAEIVQGEAGQGFDDDFWNDVFRRMSATARANLEQQGCPLPELEIGPDNFGNLLEHLRGLCEGDDERRRAVDAYHLDSPQLATLTGEVHPMREKVQPHSEWTFDHSPWRIQPVNMQSLYEIARMR